MDDENECGVEHDLKIALDLPVIARPYYCRWRWRIAVSLLNCELQP